jgi:putative membrane protein
MGGATGMGAVGGGGWLVPLLVLLVLAALVAALAYAWMRTAGDVDGDADAAMRTLRERYAAGDVDDEEFERRRTTLADSG